MTMSGRSPDERLKQGGEFYRIQAKIKLIDANDVLTSHDPYTQGFPILDEYPAIRQNRGRFDTPEKRTKFETERIENFDPQKVLFDTGGMQTGLPVISDGFVDAGNGRVM